MIDSITIRNVATYDDTGIEITDLQKVNFIYGANGSGKTTITKFLYKPDEPLFENCSLNWTSGIALSTIVYNKDFRDRNFGKGTIKGVFTLGQANKEELEAINALQVYLMNIKENIIKKRATIEKQKEQKESVENEFKETAWITVFKKYEVDFKDAFIGYQRKDAFKVKLLQEFSNNTSELKTLTELKEKAKTIFAKAPTAIPFISQINFQRLLEIEENGVWKKKIVGSADVEIAKLIRKLNLNDWVNEGRKYMQDDEVCPFCQKPTISEDFKSQLERYFDESFVNDTSLVKTLSEEYNQLSQNILNELAQIESRENANPGSKLKVDTFSAYIKTLYSQFVSNKERIANKSKEPSRSIDLISIKLQLESIHQVITDANAEIKKHNDLVANYSVERTNLIQAIWRFLAEENKTDIQVFIKKSNGLQKGIDALETQLSDLEQEYRIKDNELKEKNKNVTSIQPSVDEINRILKAYGFQNFKLLQSKTEKNQYQIQREDGSLAESTLSEGEITFITFLYFLQLAKGSISEENITDERVLVIDDPISSLDSNILFVVSSLLKKIIKGIKKDEGNIRQLVLLTHNVYFHKEASFIDGRTKESADTHYWILRKNNNISTIQDFKMKNPIQNSYELLWQELKNRENSSGITIQNTMRRIIENYFKILGKYGDDDLISKFSDPEEKEIGRSLISWINDGSHSIPDDLFIEHQENITTKYFEVFKSVFVHNGHKEHYLMMMGERLTEESSLN